MKTRHAGFSIVELILVIAIIAILAAITIVGLGNWRTRTAKTEVRNEVVNGAAAAKKYQTFNNALPADQTAFNGQYAPANEVSLTYTRRADGLSFCLKGMSTADTTVIWYIDSAVNYQPQTTACT